MKKLILIVLCWLVIPGVFAWGTQEKDQGEKQSYEVAYYRHHHHRYYPYGPYWGDPYSYWYPYPPPPPPVVLGCAARRH